MSRQAGKNEVSTRIESTLLAVYGLSSPRPDRTFGVKGAPTQTPQAVRSLTRLAAHLRHTGFRGFNAGDGYVALGAASWWFGSGEPNANVVGGTANLLLECDEAQDFNEEKWDKDYRPMAAATAAATILYGTAWSDFDLLEKNRLAALELEKKRGRQYVFDVPWWRVAEEVPTYALFVEAERARLGHTDATPHPIFRTQYELVCMAGAGRLFKPAQLDAMLGKHPRELAPKTESHNVYVAGLDVGGANLSGAEDPDETVLTIARSRFPGRGQVKSPHIEVVLQVAWKGVDHDAVRYDVLRQLRAFGVVHVAVDATGIGEPIASFLIREMEGAKATGKRVTALKVTRENKSQLGFDMLAAVNTGALKLWQPDAGDADHAALLTQARLARSEYLAGKLLWHVDPADGHDDRLFSLALAVRAAERGRPRVATQRNYRG